jgi:hypothetical protein
VEILTSFFSLRFPLQFFFSFSTLSLVAHKRSLFTYFRPLSHPFTC